MADPSLLAYVAERTGMKVAGAQQRRLSRVLSRACQESGLSAQAYAELLHRERSAFDALADDLTIGETYFFRERPQLELLRDAVEQGRPANRPLRAWSAGCSTGEEAYTLAMLLRPAAAPHGVEVTGTDLSPTALSRAEDATYGMRSLRSVMDDERGRWFEPVPRGRVRVRQPVLRAVRFAAGNLLDGPPRPAAFDVVLCRNVLIYLSPEAVSRVAAALRDALAPDGWLLTGVADPLLEAEGLQRVSTPDGLLYRRERGSLPMSELRRPPRAAAPGPVRQRAAAAATAVAVPAAPLPAAPAAAPLPASAPEPAPSPVVAGSLEAALAAVDAFPIDAAARYRLALLHLERGDLRAAADAATAATFLDPGLVVAHLLLGRVHEGLRDARAAHRCFRTAASLLDGLPGAMLVPHADGETAEVLARVVGSSLAATRPAPRGQQP